MRISDWSSDVCSSDLFAGDRAEAAREPAERAVRESVRSTTRRGESCLDREHGGGGPDGAGTPYHRLRTCLSRLPRLCEESEVCRSEERRVGKECVSTCRSRWSPSL